MKHTCQEGKLTVQVAPKFCSFQSAHLFPLFVRMVHTLGAHHVSLAPWVAGCLFFFCPFAVASICRTVPYAHTKQLGSQSDARWLQQVPNVATCQNANESFKGSFVERNFNSARSREHDTDQDPLFRFLHENFGVSTNCSRDYQQAEPG